MTDFNYRLVTRLNRMNFFRYSVIGLAFCSDITEKEMDMFITRYPDREF